MLDAEHIERCVLWGFSRGAAIVSRVAGSVPERVEFAVLGSPPAHGGAYPDELVDALMAGDWAPFLELTAAMGDVVLFSRMAADNDPVAIGAVFRARGRRVECGWSRRDCRRLRCRIRIVRGRSCWCPVVWGYAVLDRLLLPQHRAGSLAPRFPEFAERIGLTARRSRNSTA